jgi:hypothetical protein
MIREREKGNPRFSFLRENGTVDNLFYRWKVFSRVRGDKDDHWTVTPTPFYEGGPLWIPPTGRPPYFDDVQTVSASLLPFFPFLFRLNSSPCYFLPRSKASTYSVFHLLLL